MNSWIIERYDDKEGRWFKWGHNAASWSIAEWRLETVAMPGKYRIVHKVNRKRVKVGEVVESNAAR